MSHVPNWYEFALLALAAYRVFRLIADDVIMDRPRRWILRIHPSWQEEGDFTGEDYRQSLGLFITCPWCIGFWIALAWWAAWLVEPHWVTVAAVPWALSALVGIIAHALAE